MHVIDQRLRELERRRRRARWLGRLYPALAAGATVGMVLVIVVRLAFPELSNAVWPIVAASLAVPLLLTALWPQRREPSANVAGRLDQLSGQGGVVMALAEVPADERDPDWVDGADRALSSIRWRPLPTRGLGLATLAALALVAVTLIPQRLPAAGPPIAPPHQTHFQAVTAALDQAAALDLIPPEADKRLREQLERLDALAQQSGMSQSVWEGLDRAHRQLMNELRSSESKLAEAIVAAQTAAMPRAGDLPAEEDPALDPASEEARRKRDRDRLKPKDPEAPATDPDEAARLAQNQRLLERLTRERATERMSQLAKALDGLGQQAAGLLERGMNLSPEAQKALEQLLEEAASQGLLDKAAEEARKRLAEAMKQGAKPGEAGDASGAGAGGGEPLTDEQVEAALKALEQALKDGKVKLGGLGGGGQLDALIARLGKGARAGAGGRSRGPGHAPLTRRDEETPAIGEVEDLPQGASQNPDGSITLGTSTRDPEADEAALRELVRGGARAFDPAHADARRVRVSPRHRRVVGRYFNDDTQ